MNRIAVQTIAVVVLAAGLAACGAGSSAPGSSSAGALARLQNGVERGLERSHRLAAKVDRLHYQLVHEVRKRRAAARTMAQIRRRLTSSLDNLQGTTATAQSVTSAEATASDALKAAGAAARDIAVLRQRLDYHLSHGAAGGEGR